MSQEPLSFEQSFARLEQILNAMNSGKVSLEESLKLFEEAEYLIGSCNHRLDSAEQKIEQLIKNKSELTLNADNKPQTAPFKT